MTLSFHAGLFAFVLFCFMPPASAAPDQAGADHLKQIFSSYLEDQTSKLRRHGEDLKAEGTLLVEPSQYYYAITMPHLSIHHPDGRFTDIGILAINAMPSEKKGEWKLTIAVPTPVLGYDSAKKLNTRVDIGAQSFVGIWNESVNNFTKLDARYEDMRIQNIADGVTGKIDKTTILYDLTPSPDGLLWSGPVTYTLDNFEILRTSDSGPTTIGRLEMKGSMDGFSPSDAAAVRSKGAGAETLSPVQLYDMAAGSVFGVMNGFKSEITASNIRAITPQGPVTLSKIGLGLDVSGMRSGSMGFKTFMLYDGLKFDSAQKDFDYATPSQLRLNIDIDKIPYQDLIALGKTNLQKSLEVSESSPAQNAQLMTLALQILTKAGTTLNIRDSLIRNDTYNVAVQGNILTDVDAMMKTVGKIAIEISGMDRLNDLAKKQSKDDTLDPDTRRRIQQMMLITTILHGLGQKQEGTESRRYDLELDKAGKLTLNGTDLSVIQGMFSAMNQKDQAQPPAPAGGPPSK